jgi:hypothetical protein
MTQLVLFNDNDSDGAKSCRDCGTPVPPPHLPGTLPGIECLECNYRRNLEALTHYAKHGQPGGPKRPGMLFPGQRQGDREPTADQRAAAKAILDRNR